MIARPTATSAAATVMMKKTNTCRGNSAGRSPDAEAGEGDERQVGRVEHQLQRHEDDDDVAPQDDAGEADRERAARSRGDNRLA